MLLPLVALLGGILSLASPCILPIMPVILAREVAYGRRGRLAYLAGLTASFAVEASLLAATGGWAVAASHSGRLLGLALLALFGAALLRPSLAARLATPLVSLGGWLTDRPAATSSSSRIGALLTGMATGFVWTPCAGPILGLVLTLAVLHGPGLPTILALLCYSIGFVGALGVLLATGQQLVRPLRIWTMSSTRLHAVLGASVLATVTLIATGSDTRIISLLPVPLASAAERALLVATHPALSASKAEAATAFLPSPLDALTQEGSWVSGPPLDRAALRGKVVLVNFWTYSCINCLRALPYVRQWADKYGPAGLTVIGVHTPEFAFEKNAGNVREALHTLHVSYPVIQDNDFAIWNAFQNDAWPALILLDPEGKVEVRSIGEGDYDAIERRIVRLLNRAHGPVQPADSSLTAPGTQAPADLSTLGSEETYLGYAKAERFGSRPAERADVTVDYNAPDDLALNQWALAGRWTVASEYVTAVGPGASVLYRSRARDLHLVLAPAIAGQAVHFRVTVDGRPPGDDHGTDTDPSGLGTVSEAKLYQLVRQHGAVGSHTVRIEFDTPGVKAYAFTFG